MPCAQGEQEVEPVLAVTRPAAQAEQLLEPSAVAKVLSGHGAHAYMPGCAKKPGLHAVQVVEPGPVAAVGPADVKPGLHAVMLLP